MASSAVVNHSQQPASTDANPVQFLMQMSSGYMISASMYVVAKLQIADHLAKGPRSVAELAQETHTNEDALYRVLRALSSVGIFEAQSDRKFALNANSHFMRAEVPGSLRDMVLWMTNKLHFDTWGEMMHSVQTGQSAIEHVFKKPCFEVFEPGVEHTVEFNNAMTNFSQANIPAVLAAYDFSGIDTLVDIGGGHGYLLCEIVKKYPAMKGIVFDMEQVVSGARVRIHQDGLHGRVSCHAGSFFESVPAGDAYIMQHIIHDWNDEKALTILKNVRHALGSQKNGKLLVLDSVIHHDCKGEFTPWLDLEMLLMPGGRERTEAEFRSLFAHAGFKLTRVIQTPGPATIIEGVPA
jgi:O-methyltransferase domain/Dimerisation domain